MVQGRSESASRGDAGLVFRPRPATAKVSAAACAAFLVTSLATGSRESIWLAAIPFLLFVQCFQHVGIDGHRARRTGLRAVELDLSTAEVKATGRSWWVELFFLGRCLELRDADGRELLLESWLWSKATRDALVDAARAANPALAQQEISPPTTADENGGTARS